MTSTTPQNIDLDTKLLADFIFALNIVRRQVQSYPVGHPMVVTATRNLVAVVPRLLEFRDRITLGIARDTLLVDGAALDKANPVYRDLAKSLFDVQIASLTISRDLTEEEICRFFAMLRNTPEELDRSGGIEASLTKAGFRGLQVQGIDFSAFSTTEMDVVHAPKTRAMESDAANLWKAFADGMIRGALDPQGEASQSMVALDPALLAEVINRELDADDSRAAASYEEAITGFLQAADQKNLRDQAYQQTLGRLGDMATRLRPELRRKFLNSMLKTCAGRPETAEGLLGQLPQALLLDAIETIDAGKIEIPQTLLDVLGKLSLHRDEGVSTARVAGVSSRSAEETAQQLAKLFSEDRSEFFVPKDYQDALTVMAAAKADPFLTPQQTEDLFSSLKTHTIEKHFCGVLLDLVNRDVDAIVSGAIGLNLVQSINYFVETGDYPSLSRIHADLHHDLASCPAANGAAINDALAVFAGEPFAEAVLDGFDTWGKPAHAAIEALVAQVGAPFITPLLDRLAEESAMARRRLYMECLVRIGDPVMAPIADRLNDERWYFVRNLVLVLRELKDPAVVPVLEGMAGHRHPKVQYEVMKTLLLYGSRHAHRFLGNGLAGRDPVALLNAVRLAVNSRDAQVVVALARVLNARLPAEQEAEIKANVIKTLEDVATEAVLPELARFLKGKKLFGGSKSQSLKLAALGVLEKIGTLDAGILAGEIAQTTTGELARRAEAVLAKIHGELT